MAIAGKTGTTNDSKDRWFVGYTPYYVAATWVGYDKQKEVKMTGNPAAIIWKAVMQDIHKGLVNVGFSRPSGVVSAEICADSGLLATDACKNDPRGSRVKTEIFVSGTVPTEECNVHKYVTVCADTYKLPNPTCTEKNTLIQRVFIDRGYEEEPSKLPKDYDYEIPHTYCNYHYCPIDDYGNYITPFVDDNKWNDIELYDNESVIISGD